MSRKDNPMRASRMTITFLACVLMAYACTMLFDGVHAASIEDAMFAGAVLGAAYLVIRPVLRLLTLPIGCLTLGISNFVIDIVLLMMCDGWIEGFAIDGIGWAAVSALCVNAVVLIAGGWK